MNGREFMDAVQYIDEDLLAAAEEMRSGAGPAQVRRFRFRRFAAVAALFVPTAVIRILSRPFSALTSCFPRPPP